MKKLYVFLLSIFFSHFVYAQKSDNLKNTSRYYNDKFLLINYDQFQYGFIGVGASLDINDNGYTWYSASAYLNYNPWAKISSFSIQGEWAAMGICVGGKIIEYSDFNKYNTAFRPFLGFDVQSIFKFNFGYNIRVYTD